MSAPKVTLKIFFLHPLPIKNRPTRAFPTPDPGALRPSPTPCVAGFRLAKASLRPPHLPSPRPDACPAPLVRPTAFAPSRRQTRHMHHCATFTYLFPFPIYPLAALHDLRCVLRTREPLVLFALVIGGKVRCRATGGVACYFPDGRALRERWVSGRGLETAGRERGIRLDC